MQNSTFSRMNLEGLARIRMARKKHDLNVPALHVLQHCSDAPGLIACISSSPDDPRDNAASLQAALEGIASDATKPKYQRRDAIVAIAELAECTATPANRLRLYKLVVQVLHEPDTSWQPWFAAAVMRLAQTLAACCCLEASHPSITPLPAQGQPSSKGRTEPQAPAYGGVLAPPPQPSSSSALQPASSIESGELPALGSPGGSAGLQALQECHQSNRSTYDAARPLVRAQQATADPVELRSSCAARRHTGAQGELGERGAACPLAITHPDLLQHGLQPLARRHGQQETHIAGGGEGGVRADAAVLHAQRSEAEAHSSVDFSAASPPSCAAADAELDALLHKRRRLVLQPPQPSQQSSGPAADTSMPSVHASTSAVLGPAASHAPSNTTQPASGGGRAGREEQGLPWAHAQTLQRGLLAWCGHWHPRVRRAALASVLAAHEHQVFRRLRKQKAPQQQGTQQQGMQQQQQQPSQDPQHNQDLEQPNQGLRHPNQGMQQRDQAWTPQQRTPAVRGSCVCTSNTCAMGSYKAAVLALGDDHEGVRILALQLLFVLAQGHPCLHLQEPHFWQFSRPQSMADDAFQRLCSAAANDPEMGVRRAALQWLQGLHGASLRVKLQALNKKAIVRAEVPAAGESAQPGKGQKKGKGRRQQGAVFTGRMGGGPWAGCPSTHSLDLLDASMGALVHGTEDELSQVRAATAGALAALGVSELLALGKMLRPAAGMRGGKDGRGGKRGADVDSDVLADRRQAACQSAEYLVDLLHDEVQVVREAAAQGLLQLARHARPTFLAAKQPRGSGAGVPDATPSLHNISGMDGKAAARLAVGVHGSSAGAGAEVQEQPQAHDAAGVSLLGRQTQAECLQNVAEAGAEAQEQPQAHDTADYADLFGGHVRTEVRPCDETTSGQATAPAPGADAVAAAGPLLAVLLDRDQTRSLISSLSDPSPLVRSCMRAALPFMCMSTPAVLQSLINALTQNALTFPDEAEEAKCVAKAAATCAPAHILGPALSKMLHQAQKQRQEQPHHQLQGNEQFLMIVQAMRDVLAVDRRET